MNGRWLEYVKRLQAIAATGQHFTEHFYDRERYDEIALIAETMLSELAHEPVSRIRELVPSSEEGYATPKIDVRGAVLRNEQVLLIREAADGLWTLPGGYADVGLSAAENTVKEVREEACIEVRAKCLYAVHHKSKHAYDADVRDFYKFFFLCEQLDNAEPQAGPEALDVGYFPVSKLPPLSRGRTIEADVQLALTCANTPDFTVRFD